MTRDENKGPGLKKWNLRNSKKKKSRISPTFIKITTYSF